MSIYIPSSNQEGNFLTEQEANDLYQKRALDYVRVQAPTGPSVLKGNNSVWGSDILDEVKTDKLLYYNTSNQNISFGNIPSKLSNETNYLTLNANLSGRLGTITSTLQPFRKNFAPNTFGTIEMGLFTRAIGGTILQPILLNVRINTRDLSHPLQTTVFIEIGHCNSLYAEQVMLKQTNPISLTSFFSPAGTTQYYADFNNIEVPQIILPTSDRFFYVKVFYIFANLPSTGSITTGEDFTTSSFFTKIEEIQLYGNPLPYGISPNLFLSYRNNGWTGAGNSSINIGLDTSSNYNNQSVCIGLQSGQSNQGSGAIAIGFQAGRNSQGSGAIAIGFQAGQTNQSRECVAIGYQSGNFNQQLQATSIGYQAGLTGQSTQATALGAFAGFNNQGQNAVAIGFGAGFTFQRNSAVAIGRDAGNNIQGTGAIAIGNFSGQTNQGQNAIAIGNQAGRNNQHANSIIINASGNILNSQTQNALYVNPIRQVSNSDPILTYNTNNEIRVSAPVMWNVYMSAIQSIPSGVDTRIEFNNKTAENATDPLNYLNTTNNRITPTIAGFYMINGTIGALNTPFSGRIYVSLFKNDQEYTRGDNDVQLAQTDIQGGSYSVNTLVYCNGTTDYLTIRAFTSIGSLSVDNTRTLSYWNGFLIR